MLKVKWRLDPTITIIKWVAKKNYFIKQWRLFGHCLFLAACFFFINFKAAAQESLSESTEEFDTIRKKQTENLNESIKNLKIFIESGCHGADELLFGSIDHIHDNPKLINFAIETFKKNSITSCDRIMLSILYDAVTIHQKKISKKHWKKIGDTLTGLLNDEQTALSAAEALCQMGNRYQKKGCRYFSHLLTKPSEGKASNEKINRVQTVEIILRFHCHALTPLIRKIIQNEELIEFLKDSIRNFQYGPTSPGGLLAAYNRQLQLFKQVMEENNENIK